MPEVNAQFSKNDYYNMAAEKLGMTQPQITDMLWNNYHPHKIAYIIVAIGIVTVLALFIYDKTVIKPKETLAMQDISTDKEI